MFNKLTENIKNQTKLIEKQNKILGSHGNILEKL
jgi:hypothetical protein